MAEVVTYALPSTLFRYRSLSETTFDREVAAIQDHKIYCPSFDKMNDPMEGMHRESALFQNEKDYAEKLSRLNEAKGKIGIASLSEVHDHEPMWGHYAQNFSGICVAYSFHKLLLQLSAAHEFVKMTYSETPPVLLKGRRTSVQLAKLALSTKTVRWASEREWRLIRPAVGFATYQDASAVRRVYAGARMPPEIFARLRRELAILKVPLWRMQINKYEMTFSKVPALTFKIPKLNKKKQTFT